ncbi:MAG: permease, partial [Gemmatimonadaceae bacterium]|nr:permease [Gemmatimonadaceae bacterium]
MELMQWITIAVFTITILAVVANWIDSTAAALVGVVFMIWLGVMTETDAFNLVDWNVIAILVSIWIIAGYFGKTGVPSWLSVQALKLSGGRPGLLVMILSMLAGVISMFVDNVVTILMMAPVALPLARALSIPVAPLVLMIGFSANFMGSALLLGDLPPQMLHSVAGVEFGDFIWHQGRLSSFPILMVTFIITLAFMWAYGFRKAGTRVNVAE